MLLYVYLYLNENYLPLHLFYTSSSNLTHKPTNQQTNTQTNLYKKKSKLLVFYKKINL